MYYQYRWGVVFSIILVVFGLSYFYDISPTLAIIRETKSRYNDKKNDLRKIQALVNLPINKRVNPLSTLSILEITAQLLAQLEQQQLIIEAMNWSSSDFHQEGLKVQLKLQGDFKQFYAFIDAMQKKSYPWLLLNFSANTDSKRLHFDLVLMHTNKIIIIEPLTANAKSSDAIDNALELSQPFCLPNKNQSKDLNLMLRLQTTPLHLLKMVGYFSHEKKGFAFLELPEKELVLVEQGSSIGLEKGVVSEIFKDKTHVLLPGNISRWIYGAKVINEII